MALEIIGCLNETSVNQFYYFILLYSTFCSIFVKKNIDSMIKALLLDVDGTLLSFETHKVSQSSIDALKKYMIVELRS